MKGLIDPYYKTHITKQGGLNLAEQKNIAEAKIISKTCIKKYNGVN